MMMLCAMNMLGDGLVPTGVMETYGLCPQA